MGNNIEKEDDDISENVQDIIFLENKERKNYFKDFEPFFPSNFENKNDDDFIFINPLKSDVCFCNCHLHDNIKGSEKKRQIKFNYNNIINKINAHFFNSFIIDLIKNNSIKNDVLLKKIIA